MHKNIINDLKYHYVYKIIHIPTGRYYIGIHSTNNLNDGYRGSGRIIKNMYKKHPIIEFVKEILYYGESRDDILKKETELVTEEILKKDPLILNLDIGGRSGNKIAVSGIISVKDKDGNILKVSNNDPRYLSGELQHINKGNKYNVSYKPLYKDGVYIHIQKELIQKYLDDGWIIQSKCKGRVSPTKNLTHIKKGEKEIMVKKDDLQEYLDNGWQCGRIAAPVSNKIMIHKDNIDKYINEDELQKHLDNGWKKGGKSRNKGRIMLVNKNTGEYISVYKDDPRYQDPNYVNISTYNGSPSKGTKYMHKDNIIKRVKPDKIQEYLDQGFSFGTGKNKK